MSKNTASLQQLYVTYFNRPADVGGLQYWEDQMANKGISLTTVQNSFATSSEYVGNNAGMSTIQLINQLYVYMFGRVGDAAGVAWWNNQLVSGNYTIATLAAEIAKGAAPGSADAIAVANKVTAATNYTNELVKSTADMAAYNSGAAFAVASDWLRGVTTNASLNTAATTMGAAIANGTAAASGPSQPTFVLTTGLDTGAAFSSAAGNSVFNAGLVNNSNTFQSGDSLKALGTGNVLNADLGNSANFAILATTSGIQTVSITAEAQATASGTNNVSTLPVQINALRMANVTNWIDNQSRADVVIENIQLPNGNASSDLTSAVTFTMRDTQPGAMTLTGKDGEAAVVTHGPSFSAYFDPQALKAGSTAATATVDVALINTGPTANSANPLSSNLYTGFTVLNGTTSVTFNFTAADQAAILAATLANNQQVVDTAIINAVAAYNTANGTNYTATISTSTWQPHNSATGAVETAIPVTIALAGSTLNLGSWIIQGGSAPANYAIGNYQSPTPVAGSTSLITSNLILDNVGQGGYPQFQAYSGSTEGSGGDVIIGSMATSGGVQQFNVDVQRTSWINSLNSTNNTLQLVNIVSDAALSPTTGGQGLAIGAEIATGSLGLTDWTVPGVFVNTNGLTDVKTIDATGFKGSLEIGESITYAAFSKYVAGATGVQNFSITLGNQENGFVLAANHDNGYILPGNTASFNSVNLAIDSTVAASGNFKETITGGTGNDLVQLSTDQGIGHVNTAGGNWVTSVTDLKNIVVNVGEGNNLVKFDGAGFASISGGTGNDAYYVDNTGGIVTVAGVGVNASVTKAVWVDNAGVTTIFTPNPGAVVTIQGTGAVAQKETTYWTGVNSATATDPGSVTEIVSTSAADVQGITIVATQAASATPVSLTSQDIAVAVQQVFDDYALHGGFTEVHTAFTPVANFSVIGTGWNTLAGIDTLTETYTVNGNTVVVTVGSDYVVGVLDTATGHYVQSAVDAAQGSNSLTNYVAGATTVWGSGPVTNVIGTLGSNAVAETVTATWSALNGVGSTETIDGYTVTNTTGAAFTAVQVASVAAGGVVAGLTLSIVPPATGPTVASVTQVVGTGVTTITYGVGVVDDTVSTAVSSHTGAIAPTTETTVSLDAYGNYTTSNAQSSAASHTFTGSGETVTVTFEGYSVTATITAGSTNAASTYTSTDINNAIASAVNTDATMSKLLHVTQGSSGQSLIFSSLVDGLKDAPTVAFAHTGTTGVDTTSAANPNLAADTLALSGYTTVVEAKGDGTTTGGTAPLTGADSGLVNNSTIIDTGSTGTGYNLIDLSSNSQSGADGQSANTVLLSGTGQSIITNYKVGLDSITTSATHAVVLNSVDDSFQATYTGAGMAGGVLGGLLNVSAEDIALLATSGVYVGASTTTATHASGAVTGAGLVVVEDATTNTTSVYHASNVANLATSTFTLEAVLVGVTPVATAIHLV